MSKRKSTPAPETTGRAAWEVNGHLVLPRVHELAAIFLTIAARVVAGVIFVPRWTLMAGHIAADYAGVHDVAEGARLALLASPAPRDAPRP